MYNIYPDVLCRSRTTNCTAIYSPIVWYQAHEQHHEQPWTTSTRTNCGVGLPTTVIGQDESVVGCRRHKSVYNIVQSLECSDMWVQVYLMKHAGWSRHNWYTYIQGLRGHVVRTLTSWRQEQPHLSDLEVWSTWQPADTTRSVATIADQRVPMDSWQPIVIS